MDNNETFTELAANLQAELTRLTRGLEKLQRKHKAELDEQKAFYEQERLVNANNLHNQKGLASPNATWEKGFREHQAEPSQHYHLQKQLDKQKADHDKELTRQKADYDKELARQKAEYEEKLKDCQTQAKREREKLQGDLSALVEKARKLEAAVQVAEEKVQKSEAELNGYREKFFFMQNASTNLESLSPNAKQAILNAIGNPSNDKFIYSLVQEKYLESLWNATCHLLNNGIATQDDSLLLDRLFRFAFAASQATNPKYHLLDFAVGSEFRTETMQRLSQSSKLGKVRQQYLPGYRLKSGEVQKLALVVLG